MKFRIAKKVFKRLADTKYLSLKYKGSTTSKAEQKVTKKFNIRFVEVDSTTVNPIDIELLSNQSIGVRFKNTWWNN